MRDSSRWYLARSETLTGSRPSMQGVTLLTESLSMTQSRQRWSDNASIRNSLRTLQHSPKPVLARQTGSIAAGRLRRFDVHLVGRLLLGVVVHRCGRKRSAASPPLPPSTLSAQTPTPDRSARSPSPRPYPPPQPSPTTPPLSHPHTSLHPRTHQNRLPSITWILHLDRRPRILPIRSPQHLSNAPQPYGALDGLLDERLLRIYRQSLHADAPPASLLGIPLRPRTVHTAVLAMVTLASCRATLSNSPPSSPVRVENLVKVDESYPPQSALGIAQEAYTLDGAKVGKERGEVRLGNVARQT